MAKLVQQLVEAVRRFVYQILFPLLLAIFGEIRWSPPQWFRRVADAVRAALSVFGHRSPRWCW